MLVLVSGGGFPAFIGYAVIGQAGEAGDQANCQLSAVGQPEGTKS